MRCEQCEALQEALRDLGHEVANAAQVLSWGIESHDDELLTQALGRLGFVCYRARQPTHDVLII